MTLTLLNRMSRTVAVSGGEMHIRLTDDDVLFDVGYDERVRKGSASHRSPALRHVKSKRAAVPT